MPSALDDLLSTERDVAEQLQAADRSAAALIAAARADAGTIERDAATELTREIAALDERDAAARAELARGIADAGAKLAAHYRTLPPAEIARLAAVIVAAITGVAPGTAP